MKEIALVTKLKASKQATTMSRYLVYLLKFSDARKNPSLCLLSTRKEKTKAVIATGAENKPHVKTLNTVATIAKTL